MHASRVDALTRFFVQAVGDGAIVSIQRPVRLSKTSEPQPDISVLRPRGDFYRDGHPTADDVLLLIEVSDTTLRFDLDDKRALYARHGIPEYWVIDTQAKQLHCLREPSGDSYRSATVFGVGQMASMAALPNVVINLNQLLG